MSPGHVGAESMQKWLAGEFCLTSWDGMTQLYGILEDFEDKKKDVKHLSSNFIYFIDEEKEV